MDQQSIKDLIELVNSSNIGEVKIEQGNFKLTIRHKDYHSKGIIQTSVAPSVSAPVVVPSISEGTKAESVAETVSEKPVESEPPVDKANYQTIKSPMIGTFYRSPSPDQDAFVKVGDTVQKGDVLGIIEAMKLFNEIESELSGTIVKVLVDNATAIEYDQDLFLIDPS